MFDFMSRKVRFLNAKSIFMVSRRHIPVRIFVVAYSWGAVILHLVMIKGHLPCADTLKCYVSNVLVYGNSQSLLYYVCHKVVETRIFSVLQIMTIAATFQNPYFGVVIRGVYLENTSVVCPVCSHGSTDPGSVRAPL